MHVNSKKSKQGYICHCGRYKLAFWVIEQGKKFLCLPRGVPVSLADILPLGAHVQSSREDLFSHYLRARRDSFCCIFPFSGLCA